MKLSLINKILIITAAVVLISGIALHVGYTESMHDHSMTAIGMLIHIFAACVLLIFAGMHITYNRWWFKTLKIKAKTSKVIMQRIFTPLTVLMFLALVITGLMMLCGWYPAHSHIWIWHYAIGLAWVFIAACHGIVFMRRKK